MAHRQHSPKWHWGSWSWDDLVWIGLQPSSQRFNIDEEVRIYIYKNSITMNLHGYINFFKGFYLHLQSTPKSIRKTLETRVWRIRINVSQAKPLVRNYVGIRDTPAQETTYLNLVVMVLEQSGSVHEHVPALLPKCLVYIFLYLIYRLAIICMVYILISLGQRL